MVQILFSKVVTSQVLLKDCKGKESDMLSTWVWNQEELNRQLIYKFPGWLKDVWVSHHL